MTGAPGPVPGPASPEAALPEGGARRLLLSLDGFEPTGGGLAPFVEYLLERRPELPALDRAAVRQATGEVLALPGAATSGPWAIAFALLLATPGPAGALARWRRERGGEPARHRSASSLLEAVIAGQTPPAPVRVRLDARTTLADPWRRWLVERLASDPRVGLDLSREVAPPGEPVEVAPLAIEEPLARQFVFLAALCGEVAPARPILASLGLGAAELDGVLDLLDERCCGTGDDRPLEDLGYRHPGFPDHLTYRFRDQGRRLGILAGERPEALAVAARELRCALRPHLEVTTRSIAQLFVNLGELEGPPAGAGPRQRLRLWVGGADEGGLVGALAEDVRRAVTAPSRLLASALQDGSLSVTQRLALLTAAEAGAVAREPAVVLPACLARTRLLHATGRFEEAARCAAAGLRWLEAGREAGDGALGALLYLSARCLRELRRPAEAARAFAAAAGEAAIPDSAGRVDHHNLGACLAEAGRCHAERRDWALAIQALGEAVVHLKLGDLGGVVHAEELDLVMRNLAACEAQRMGLRR